jgi:hypothetical protein
MPKRHPVSGISYETLWAIDELKRAEEERARGEQRERMEQMARGHEGLDRRVLSDIEARRQFVREWHTNRLAVQQSTELWNQTRADRKLHRNKRTIERDLEALGLTGKRRKNGG